MAFNRPLSGSLTLDGRDLASIRLKDYRNQLGVVLQDNFLFDGTIAENISFSHPHATREEIIAASRIAHCEEFIDGFADGYDTVVGERGVKLSGGQRQRIAIARVVLKDAPILVLDEATSALDSEVELAIQEQLLGLMEGKTVIAIAHRLSTIARMDRLIVLDAGRIVEEGTHQELLARGGHYRQLWRHQSGGFLGHDVVPTETATDDAREDRAEDDTAEEMPGPSTDHTPVVTRV